MRTPSGQRIWPTPTNQPWRYRRRISTLSPLSKREPIFRTDWLEAARGEAIAGTVSIAALAIADVLADASTRHGNDINYLTHAEIAKRCRKRNLTHFKARWAARGLTELRAAGLIDWDHGTNQQRDDTNRRQRLNGRWQGPCIYRLLIPAHWAHSLTERRRAQRATKRNRHLEERHARRQRAREAALLAAARAAQSATTWHEGLALLECEPTLVADAELWNLALEQLAETWRSLHPPPHD